MIWVLIFSLLFIFTWVLSKKIFSTVKNPISIFCLLWCLIGMGSNAAFYGYYEPSTTVNIIILIGCIVSFFTYGLSLQGYNKRFFVEQFKSRCDDVEIRRVMLVNVLCIIILIPYVIRSFNVLIAGGFSVLRSQNVIENGFLAILNDSVIRPIFTATTILSIVYSFSNAKRKHKIKLLILSIIVNIEQVILSAGRAPLVNLVFYLIIALVLFYGKSIQSILYRGRKYILFGAIMGIAVLKITSQRSMASDENIFLYNTYVYYFSGPAYLSQLIKNVTAYGPGGKLLYGAASFGFISNIISDILIFLTGKAQGSLYLLGSVISNNQYRIGVHTSINAMYTCFYPFLIDYGWIGIIICPLFMGIVSGILTKRLYKNQSSFNICLYIYWIYVIIRTVFKWDLVNIDFTVVIIILYYFTKRKIFDDENISVRKDKVW